MIEKIRFWLHRKKIEREERIAMMDCPEAYIQEQKHKSFQELLEEKSRLIDEIAKLEEIVFFDDEQLDESWTMDPSPNVIYQVYLEYLAALCEFISEKYRKYIYHE